MKNKHLIIVAMAVGLVILGFVLAGKPAAQSPTPEVQSAMTAVPEKKAPAALEPVVDSPLLKGPQSTDFVMGKEDAPITLIEYASLSCPHCAHFHNDVLPALTDKYIAPGKLRYILRQFPLNEPAFAGALLVTCVGDQGGPHTYYTFNRVLFDAQGKWAFDKNFKDSLKTFAEVGGISAQIFEACMNDTKLEKRILEGRKAAADQLQIDSTPYLFINGRPHKGNRSLEAISADIDALLNVSEK